MPSKTKKTPAKKTTSSKSKNTKGSLLSKINFKSRKTQLVVTVLAFALIGGAWFTYKSFAAEPIQVATYNKVHLNPHSDSVCKTSGIYSIKESQKNGSEVWVVPAGTCLRGSYVPAANIKDNYRFCVLAMGSNVKFSTPWLSANGQGVPNNNTHSFNSPSGYNKYCTGYYMNDAGRVKAPTIKIVSGTARISMVTIERLGTAAPATAPAPAPAK